MTRHLLPATAVAAALLMPHHSMSAAKPGGNLVDLGTLGGGFSDASGINNDPNSVQVVGRSRRADGFVHAFFWRSPGPMVDLGSFGGGNSYALDINDHGQIAGTSEDASGGQWAAVWRLSGSTWPIENLGTARRLPGLGGGTTYALAVNNSGDVAGFSTDPSGTRHAVRWRASDGWTVEDLGTLGGCCSEGYGINSFGDVVGVSNLGKRSGTQHGFLARPDALMADLAAQGQSAARDLNDFGAVVGGGGGRGVHAVLWRVP